jgi:hypothetical protein
MNARVRLVLYFLCFTFLIGVGVFFRNYKDKKNLETIVIKKTTNDMQSCSVSAHIRQTG